MALIIFVLMIWRVNLAFLSLIRLACNFCLVEINFSNRTFRLEAKEIFGRMVSESGITFRMKIIKKKGRCHHLNLR